MTRVHIILDAKTVYYPKGWNAQQICSGCMAEIDNINTLNPDIEEGPYERTIKTLPPMVLRTLDFKIGPFDVLSVTSYSPKEDWKFIAK